MGAEMTEESRINLDGLKQSDVALLKDVAELAAKKAVFETFTAMGIDPNEPFEAQKDMQWVRSRRQWGEKGAWHAATALITLLVTGGAIWIWNKAGLK